MLQRQARQHRLGSLVTKRSADDDFGSEGEGEKTPQHEQSSSCQSVDHAQSVWTSPFTLPSTTIRNMQRNRRNWIWLAPSSMWSFTARLTVMLSEKLHLESPYDAPNFSDRDIYPLKWKSAASDDPPNISGLPSIDHALYLFNTVKFHLGQNYRFFDEEAFVTDMKEFYYGNALEKATRCRLWFVQFLLILCFGNAFLSRSRNTRDPPGAKFFVRAMSLMPDLASMWKDSLLAIEILALVGLYLYSTDHRESAHVYVGQAIRIAQMEGLHTQLPEDELGAGTLTRCRNLWWTLYIMDRHISSSLGLPMTTPDSDITTVIDPPSTCLQRDAILSLNVRLSHLLSFILTTVYRTQKTHLATFLDKTRSILHTMAGHAREIETIIYLKFQNSVDTVPKGTRHVTLLYHQCVIVATRPLLLSVLKERLEKLNSGAAEDWQSCLAPIKSLISTGIKSAAKTLQILSDEDSLLEAFLPFDLEFAYGAAVHLTMANTLFPRMAEGQTYSQNAHSILDEMTSAGNRLAEARKAELTHLEALFRELTTQTEQRDRQIVTSSNTEQGKSQTEDGISEGQQEQTATTTVVSEIGTIDRSLDGGDSASSPSVLPRTANDLEFLDDIGISSCEFLSIVDQIGCEQEGGSLLDPGQSWKEGI